MTTNYEVWLTDDNGLRLALLDNFIKLNCSKVANAIGNITMQMPLSFDRNLLRPDNMIQVWRQPNEGNLSLWQVYFLRRWVFEIVDGRDMVTLAGPDINDLLRRRIVAAYSGSTQATKTDFAGNIMNDLVSEAILDSAAPTPTFGTRVWSDLSVQLDADTGVSMTKSFAWDKLLTTSDGGVLRQLADASFSNGQELYFDIVPEVITASSITFQFRTYNDQPRLDVASKVIFSEENSNLRNPRLEYDYTEEENYIYVGGQGEGIDRVVSQRGDFNAYSASKWARCEGFVDARTEETLNGTVAAAYQGVNEGKGRIRFSGDPLDTVATRFGVDWDWGYRVTAKYLNFEAEYNIGMVALSIEDGEEDIKARMDDTIIPPEAQE